MAAQGKTQAAVTGRGSALARYREVIVGRPGLLSLIYFELCAWLALVPGAAGLMLRKMLWPRLFAACGRGTVFGANVALRHPGRIELGDNVVVSDGCILDARSPELDVAIRIGSESILANNVMISSKNGAVRVGPRAGLGTQCVVHAVGGSTVEIGADLIAGPQCYIAGGGNYRTDRTDVPINSQGLHEEEHTRLGADVWLGAKVTVLPGVTVGSGSVAAAGAVITADVPERTVCGGVPARVLRDR